MLQRRSVGQFAKERTLRLLVPFVFGCLVIVPPQAFYARKFHEGYQGTYLDFLRSYFTNHSEWDVLTGFSPAYPWFIAFLFVIAIPLLVHQTILVAVAYHVLPAVDHGPVPFLVIAVVSFALSVATYELNRRYNPARALFGLKTPPRSPGQTHTAP